MRVAMMLPMLSGSWVSLVVYAVVAWAVLSLIDRIDRRSGQRGQMWLMSGVAVLIALAMATEASAFPVSCASLCFMLPDWLCHLSYPNCA